MRSFFGQKIINYKTIDKLLLILILISATLTFSMDRYLYVTLFLLGIMCIYRSIRDFNLNANGLELVLGVFLAIYMAKNI